MVSEISSSEYAIDDTLSRLRNLAPMTTRLISIVSASLRNIRGSCTIKAKSAAYLLVIHSARILPISGRFSPKIGSVSCGISQTSNLIILKKPSTLANSLSNSCSAVSWRLPIAGKRSLIPLWALAQRLLRLYSMTAEG